MKNQLLQRREPPAGAMELNYKPPLHGWRWQAALFLVACLAFGFRYYYVVHAQVLQPVDQPNVRADAVDYYHYARNLVDHGVFSISEPGATKPVGDSYRDPGYPLFLAAWLRISSAWPVWYAGVLISQAVLGAFTVLLLVLVGRSWLPAAWSLAAGGILAVWPHCVAMNSYLLTETLVGFLCAAGLVQLNRAVARSSTIGLFVSGLFFSTAALTNAVIYPFVFLASLWMRGRKLLNGKMMLCLMSGSLVLLIPWMLRNSQLPAGSLSSTGRAIDNLVQGSWPSYHAAYQAAMRNDPNGEIIMLAIDHETTEMHANVVSGMGLLWRRISHHPLEYAAWYTSKPFLLWGWDIGMGQGDVYVYPTRNSPFVTNDLYRAVIAVCHALNGALFWCAAGGCFLVLLSASSALPDPTATALLLVYVTVVYSVLAVDPRYSTPFRGEEILMATTALRAAWIGIGRSYFRRSARAT